MASNERKILNTDFSIDHILNRAGERYEKFKKRYENVTSSSSDGDDSSDNCNSKCYENLFVEHQSLVDIQQPFHWLNYTRYNMPRMPRPSKGPLKRTSRLPRIPFTIHQLSELEKAYKSATYLSTEDANCLAKKLNLTGVRVKIWFQNRRARDRREKREIKCSPNINANNITNDRGDNDEGDEEMNEDNEVIIS